MKGQANPVRYGQIIFSFLPSLEDRLDKLLEPRRKRDNPGLNRSQHIRDLLTIGLEHYERNCGGQVSRSLDTLWGTYNEHSFDAGASCPCRRDQSLRASENPPSRADHAWTGRTIEPCSLGYKK